MVACIAGEYSKYDCSCLTELPLSYRYRRDNHVLYRVTNTTLVSVRSIRILTVESDWVLKCKSKSINFAHRKNCVHRVAIVNLSYI